MMHQVRKNIEGEMLNIAKQEARDGETPEAALLRLIDSRDTRIESMYRAADIIKGIDDPKEDRDRAMELMESTAQVAKRVGETEAQAMARLLSEDPAFQAVYDCYVEAR